MDVKMKLAEEVVSVFHGAESGHKAAENFQRVFRDRQAPAEMREFVLKPFPEALSVRCETESSSTSAMMTGLSTTLEKWSRLLTGLGLTASSSEAERLIKQGGFEIDDRTVTDPTAKLDLTAPNSYKLRIGKKRFVRIIVDRSA
jgi:tyrosyl-tRNA synthetase